MDFITPILNIIIPIIRKIWPYIIMSILAVIIWILYARMIKAKEEARRHKQNTAQMFEAANYMAKDLELTRNELKNIAYLDSTVKDMAKRLNIKPKHITEIHNIEGETTIIERVRIDTVNGSGYIDMTKGCLSGGVTIGKDSADINLTNNIDIEVVTHLDRPKGWFWKGQWAAKKWPINTVVTNKCDTNMTWINNTRVKIR